VSFGCLRFEHGGENPHVEESIRDIGADLLIIRRIARAGSATRGRCHQHDGGRQWG
jgi:hypothetical protein